MKKIITLSLFLLLGSCSHLAYHPSKEVFLTPEKMNIDYDEIEFKASDGVLLSGWHLKAKKYRPKGIFVQFHGNAQNMTSHFMKVSWLVEQGYDVFTFDYRGYGKSEGRPSQEGLYKDALAALTWAKNHAVNKRIPNLYVIGQSLGGVVALRALQDFVDEKLLKLIIIDSSFLSYQEIGASVMRSSVIGFLFSPLAYVFMSDEMEAKSGLNKISAPMLVIHGKEDKVVPFRFGKEIFDTYDGKKWFWEVEDGKHTDVFRNPTYDGKKKLLDLLTLI